MFLCLMENLCEMFENEQIAGDASSSESPNSYKVNILDLMNVFLLTKIRMIE